MTGLLLCALAPLTGCASQTRTTTLPVDTPEAFSGAGTHEIPERWWTTFEDERLNTNVNLALESNLSLRSAWERLRAARAVVERESGALWPSLEASGRAEATRASNRAEESEEILLGLTSVYEVDLWGRIRSSAQAEQYRARATLADYQTASLSLSAEIVRTWYQLAEARTQLDLVADQIETNETVLDLLENRFGTGQIRSVDILRQRQLVASTQEQRALAESRIGVLEHQLAVLLGRSPQDGIESVPERLPDPPPLPDTGVPIDLIQRRPDVQSAFNRLRAADRDLASAISSQYPRLSLSVSSSTAADNAGDLFRDWAVSFAGNLVAPIFFGGELRAEVDRSEAVMRERLYEYGQTVLVAFQEVEDALILETKQAESIQRLEQQVELATQAYEQLRVQYLNGTNDYLDVLTALDDVQQLHRALLSARLELIEHRILLYRALAGSFETARETGERS